MNKLWDELSIVPPGARIAAACLYVGFAGLFVLVNQLTDAKLGPVELTLLLFVMPTIVAVYALLVGYIYGDARRRGMRYVMWTLLAALIPNAIGIILYFLLREPLPNQCPSCGSLNKRGFAFCPTCGTALSPSCPACKRAVELAWSTCAWCGQKLG